MIRNRLLLGFFVILFAEAHVFASAINIDLDSISNICEGIENGISDITVEYETYHVPPVQLEEIDGTDKIITKGRTKYVWTSARPFGELSISIEKNTYMNEYADSWDNVTTQSYNGKIAKQHELIKGPHKRSLGIISNARKFVPLLDRTPFAFTLFRFQEQSLSQVLRNRDPELLKLDKNVKTTKGFRTIRVDRFVRLEDEELLSQRIYFSVDHAFTPVKFEYFNGKKIVATIEVLALEEVKEGLWFPKKGRMSTPSLPRSWVYEANNVIVNQGLTEGYFDLEFPPGTDVRDEITGLRYIVKPTEQQFEKWLKEEDAISRRLRQHKQRIVAKEEIEPRAEFNSDHNNILKVKNKSSSKTTNFILSKLFSWLGVGLIIVFVFAIILLYRSFVYKGDHNK